MKLLYTFKILMGKKGRKKPRKYPTGGIVVVNFRAFATFIYLLLLDILPVAILLPFER